MATNPDFYLNADFVDDKSLNTLLNEYNKINKNAIELLPINVDFSNNDVISSFTNILKTSLRQKRKLSTDNILEMINNVEGRVY